MTDDNEFDSIAGGAFSTLERQMGREAYEANLKSQEASIDNCQASTKMLQAKAQQIDILTRSVAAVVACGVVAVLPIMVMLWVLCFKEWVL